MCLLNCLSLSFCVSAIVCSLPGCLPIQSISTDHRQDAIRLCFDNHFLYLRLCFCILCFDNHFLISSHVPYILYFDKHCLSLPFACAFVFLALIIFLHKSSRLPSDFECPHCTFLSYFLQTLSFISRCILF